MAKELVFMSPISFAPWVEVSKDKAPSGIMVNISKDLEQKIGLPISFKYKPVKRFLRDLESEVDFDITLLSVNTGSGLSDLVKINPAVNSNITLLYYNNKFKNCKQIQTLISVSASQNGDQIKEFCNSTFKLIPTKNVEQRVQLFLDNKGDSLAIGAQEILRLTPAHKSALEAHKSIVLQSSESFFFINKNSVLNSPKYQKQLSEFASEMKSKYFALKDEDDKSGQILASYILEKPVD